MKKPSPSFASRTVKATRRRQAALVLAGSIAALLSTPRAHAAILYGDGTGATWNAASDWSTASGATNFLKAIGLNAAGQGPESDPVQFPGGV